MSALIVKICGLSTADTMAAALDAGADWVGLVFFPKSPRHVSLNQARELAAQARGRAEVVALTVDADDVLLGEIVHAVQPTKLQLHGRETPERASLLSRRFGLSIIKAIGLAAPGDLTAAAAYEGAADLILFDAKPPEGAVLPGGNGVAFDWTMLREARMRFMLSGGLTPETVEEAIAVSNAPAVDVSSGVERAPGVKDPVRIGAFMKAARAVSRRSAAQD